ncbi:YbaK/EbsC family protein [Tetragenococcus halophilus]|nr:YbaK/EbsC family protein [Tetragenococcus halophilus]
MAFKCIIRARTPLSLICGKSIIKQSEFFLYLLLKKSRRRLNSMQAQIWQWIILFFYVRNLSYIFFTFTTKKADFKKIHQLTGKRLKIVAKNEMEQTTGQRAGAVSPLGYDSNITIIVDEELFNQEKLVLLQVDQTKQWLF